ncbi:MAG: glycosyltransferase family 2 protein [Oscillospiraceae bacterium]|nr:glycosyltransferase family 2 protein [Oscillospiraceae bacterium]
MMKVLVIIPAYNEQENISRVVDNLIENYPQFDYVVVNDGSRDDTAQICRQNGYNLIDLPVNLGLAGGFQAGLKYAYIKNYDAAIQFDADGQHLPQYIQPMIDEMDSKGVDIVIGSRFVTEKKPFSMRMFGSYLIAFAMQITTGKKLTDPTSGMRLFNKKMIKEFAMDANYTPEPDTISYLMKNGATVSEIQVEMAERIAGESYLNPVNAMKYMTKMGISIILIQWFRKRRG